MQNWLLTCLWHFEKRVERLLTLLKQNKVPHDMREKSTSGNATPGLIVNAVATHIESFPTKQAHYATTDYKYLDSTLSIKLMYDLFKMKHPDYNISYKFYWSYFKENYNLRFGRLQTDTCVTCEQLGVKIKNNQLCDNVKRAAAAELMVHKRRSKKFYNAIKEPIPDDTIGLVIDFMANVSLPKIPVQDLYYYRQLTINTFGIHDLKTGRMVCYVYHEGDGGKGSNEVCTFIKMYIDRIDQNIKKLKIFADNCAGQNKNNAVVRFMMALVECKKFELVELFYPIRGHSFLPCDRDFSIIKRKLNKVSRLYTTHEYIQLIKSVSNNPEKFEVVEIGHEDIISFNNWWNLYYKRTCLSIESYGKKIERSQKQHFTVSMYHYMKCDKLDSAILVCREYIGGLMEHQFRLRNSTSAVVLPTAKMYETKKPIMKKKMDDIHRTLCYIPDTNLQFWKNISEWPTVENDVEKD